MRAWMLPAGCDGFEKLERHDLPEPVAGPGEVLIAPRAWSLNYRDFMVASGRYMGGAPTTPGIPLCDGAGEVVAVGEGVTRFRPGDRVQSTFFLDWLDGPPRQVPALGDGHTPGLLAERVALPQNAVVPMARTLDFAEAACLPCAGVTAWNALCEGPRPIKAGERVLVLGTGGVSMLALQIARAAGAQVIATSSSDDKLERARAQGAAHTINYRQVPEWGAHVLAEFGGAHKVIEVGGPGTAQQSMAALAMEGEVAIIGVLAPEGGANPRGLMMNAGIMRGIFVGSAAMAKALNRAIDVNKIKPLIGARFKFDQAKEAYAYAWGPDSFAKTVIEL